MFFLNFFLSLSAFVFFVPQLLPATAISHERSSIKVSALSEEAPSAQQILSDATLYAEGTTERLIANLLHRRPEFAGEAFYNKNNNTVIFTNIRLKGVNICHFESYKACTNKRETYYLPAVVYEKNYKTGEVFVPHSLSGRTNQHGQYLCLFMGAGQLIEAKSTHLPQQRLLELSSDFNKMCVQTLELSWLGDSSRNQNDYIRGKTKKICNRRDKRSEEIYNDGVLRFYSPLTTFLDTVTCRIGP